MLILISLVKKKISLEAIEYVITELKQLLRLDNNEKAYLDEFSKGNYSPSLLFESQIAERAEKHPMAKWRIKNITNK